MVDSVAPNPGKRKRRRKLPPPLPIRDGLNPSRVRFPAGAEPMTAFAFVQHLVGSQHHRHPLDDDHAIATRFAERLVVNSAGEPYLPEDVLRGNEDVWFYRVPAPENPVPYSIATVYEDDAILVVNKPPFLATMPRGRHITETATVRLRRSTGISELVPAHRLDRQTSGLLLFTKTPDVRGAYQKLFAERQVFKEYTAIADYDPLVVPARWECRIEKEPGEIQGRIVEGEPNAVTDLVSVTSVSDGEQARLEALHGPLAPQARYLLRPLTGKTHQLRLNMMAIGHPILGDMAYPEVMPEDAEDWAVPMHLTSTGLRFVDPLTGEDRQFSVPAWLDA